jgi:hypothetical protein
LKKVIFLFLFIFNFIPLVLADSQQLIITTNTLVTEEGKVRIHLTLQNNGQRTLYDVQPMVHFHHTMAMMSRIVQLEPGRKVMLENDDHPPVLRSGRYPLVIMTQYKTDLRIEPHTHIHTDSFYFREQVESAIDGKIITTLNGDESLLDISLKNNSTSFKNIRLMLLLPPALVADELTQMMGFTIRGGQEKNIKVAVKRKKGSPAIIYPVHLLVEYGEMLNHYTGDISGEVDFRSIQERTAIIPALGAIFFFIGAILLRSYFQSKKQFNFPQAVKGN